MGGAVWGNVQSEDTEAVRRGICFESQETVDKLFFFPVDLQQNALKGSEEGETEGKELCRCRVKRENKGRIIRGNI